MLICSVKKHVGGLNPGLVKSGRPTGFAAALGWFLAALVWAGWFNLSPVAQANTSPGTSSLALAWDRSPSTDVVGYRVYYGLASRRYTNSVYVGNVTSNVVSGLVGGATYYFAMTAIDATGLESDFSTEFSYTPAVTGPKIRMNLAGDRQVVLRINGSAGQVYDFFATTDMTTWIRVGSASVTSDGQAVCIDSTAPYHQFRFYKARLR